ncbi:MAG: purine-binding chemotaxis protein CheW, partial [Flavobacteriales bacterium]
SSERAKSSKSNNIHSSPVNKSYRTSRVDVNRSFERPVDGESTRQASTRYRESTVPRQPGHSGQTVSEEHIEKLQALPLNKALPAEGEYCELELVDEKKRQLQKLLTQRSLIPQQSTQLKRATSVKPKLQETDLSSAIESKPTTKLKPAVVEKPRIDLGARGKLKAEVKGETKNAFEADAIVAAEPDSVPETKEATHVEPFKSPLEEWAENGRPVWAQERFEVLLFEVSGLTLAVPLVSLGQIFPLTSELTPIFGQSDWMMGLLPTTLGKMRVVNTSLFVMPEKYDERFVESAKYAVSIDGLPWALAVDCVNQPISLEPEDIRWRGQRGKRPWLAGTVKSEMCALLDIPQMGKLLSATDKNLRAGSQ